MSGFLYREPFRAISLGVPRPGALITVRDDDDEIVPLYSDYEQTAHLPNPIRADAAGFLPPIYTSILNPLDGPDDEPPRDEGGNLMPGATRTFYAADTTELIDVFEDLSLETPASNPATADESGQFDPVYLDALKAYRVILRDQFGRLLHDYKIGAPAMGSLWVQVDDDEPAEVHQWYPLEYGVSGVIRLRYASGDFDAAAGEIRADGNGATFTPPAGVSKVRVLLVGQGGHVMNAGGSADGTSLGGGGGAEVRDIKVEVLEPVNVRVGSSINPLVADNKSRVTTFGSHVARGGGGRGFASTTELYNEAGDSIRTSAGVFESWPADAVAGNLGGNAASANHGAGQRCVGSGGGAGAGSGGVSGTPANGGDGGAGANCSAFGTDIGESGWFGGGGGGAQSPNSAAHHGQARGIGGLGGGGNGNYNGSTTAQQWGAVTGAATNGKPKSGGGGGGGNVGTGTTPIGGTGYCVVMYYDPAVFGADYWPYP